MVLSLHSVPNPIQSIRFSQIVPHFHSISTPYPFPYGFPEGLYCSAPAGARPSGCQDMRGRQSGLWPWTTAPHSALNMHQLHAGHWSGSGHNNISAGSERTPPRNASSAQTIPALRAGVSRVVRRKAPSVASFFGARPLGELWDGAFCGSAPSFPVRRRTVRSEVADRRDRDLVITVETVISEVAQFTTCCKCKAFLELHSY